MPIGEEEQVLTLAIHVKVLRVVLHDMEVERGEEIGTAQGAARVAGIGTMHHAHDIAPDLAGNLLQNIQVFNRR